MPDSDSAVYGSAADNNGPDQNTQKDSSMQAVRGGPLAVFNELMN